MEDIDILNKFDNDKLIDVVRNYKRYGYEDELRDDALHLIPISPPEAIKKTNIRTIQNPMCHFHPLEVAH